MKTCEGKVVTGTANVPVAQVTGYSYTKSWATNEKQFLDNNCNTTTTRQSAKVQVQIEGEVLPGGAGQASLEDMENGIVTIYPQGEVSGAPVYLYTGCSASNYAENGAANSDVTFSCTIEAENLDKSGIVP